MREITVTKADLKRLWTSPDTPQDFEKYFDVDVTAPADPVIKLKPNVVVTDGNGGLKSLGAGDVVLDFLNWRTRKNREKRCETFAFNNPNAPLVVSEGDSWFLHPFITDTIDYLLKYYPVHCLSAAGDTFRNKHKSGLWFETIAKKKPAIFMISAGGNDILGSQFENFLLAYTKGYDPGKNASRFLNENLGKELDSIRAIYDDVFRTVNHKYPNIHIITHGYDYIIPNNTKVPKKWYQAQDKSWLGDYMIKKGIEDQEDKKAIIKHIMDIFNDNLEALSRQYKNVHYIDLRGTIRDDQWNDEIHPNGDGYQDVALKFKKVMDGI